MGSSSAVSKSPAVEIEVDDTVVRVTNPDRVYFPARGETKLDLVHYYLSVGDGIVRALLRAAVHAAPLPRGGGRREGAPEAGAGRARRPGSRRCGCTSRATTAPPTSSASPSSPQRHLGGADVDGRVPPLEQPPRRHREARRVAHRPRPQAASATSRRCGGSRTSPTRCSTSSARSASRRPSGGNGLHVYVRIEPEHGFKDVRRAALAFAREVERRAPDDVTTTWWRKDRDPRAALRRLQPERPRPHDRRRRTRCAATRRARVSTPIRWDEVDDVEPRDFTIATVPARFAELGDLHAGIDEARLRHRAAAGVGRPRRADDGVDEDQAGGLLRPVAPDERADRVGELGPADQQVGQQHVVLVVERAALPSARLVCSPAARATTTGAAESHSYWPPAWT